MAAEAQYGLAAAYDGAGARRLAIGEYGTFLERFPRHPRTAHVGRRVEYLDEYTVTDAEGLALALLTGVGRRADRGASPPGPARGGPHPARPPGLSGAVRAWGIYAASYPDDPSAPEARFYLADCLYRLARQRQLEGRSAAGDSLRALALQEDALLGAAAAGKWSRLSQLRRVESLADSGPEDQRRRMLEAGYAGFLEGNPLSEDSRETRARALIGLADTRLAAADGDSARLAGADSAYVQLLAEAGETRWAPHASFGRASVELQRGETRPPSAP